MPSLTVARDVAAPRARVWAVFTNLSRAADHITAIEKVEMLTAGEFAEGTKWLETRKMYGKSVTEEMWVSDLENERCYVVKAGRDARYESRFDFDELDQSHTRVRFQFSSDTSGLASILGRVMWPMLRRRLAKDMSKELRELAAACELPPY